MTTTGPAYNYTVKMTCSGCSGAIERVLKKTIEEPNGFTVSLATQRVVVYGPSLPPIESVTATISKTGKQIISSQTIAPGAAVPPIEA